MALDLVYGKISRNWGVGDLIDLTSEAERRRRGGDVLASGEVGPLAKVVESETRAAFQLAAKLTSEGKLPAAERRAFKPTLQEWFALRDKRQGKFLGEDYVELANLRDAARSYRKRIEEFAKRQPLAATPPTRSGSRPGLATPILLAAGATGLALLIFSKK